MTALIEVWGRVGDDWDYEEETINNCTTQKVLQFLAQRFGGTKFKIHRVKVNGKLFDEWK